MKLQSFWAVILPALLLGIGSCAKHLKDQPVDPFQSTNINDEQTSETPNLIPSLEDLQIAVIANQEDRVRKIIEETFVLQSEHLNQILSNGETLLTYSILFDAIKVRDTLIELGADINAPNANSETPLLLAAKLKKLNSFSKIIYEKPNLDAVDLRGNTALMWTLRNGMENEAFVLLTKGADLKILNNSYRNAEYYAKESKLKKISSLIELRQKVDQGSEDINSYISVINTGDFKTLGRMVKRSPFIVSNYEEVNPLVLVLDLEDANLAIRMADFLLTSGAKINGPETAITTPLIRAVELQKLNFVILYLQERADPNALDSNSNSALRMAIKKNNFEMVNVLMYYEVSTKYTYYDSNGKKRTFNACSEARDTLQDLESDEEFLQNKKIRQRLNCRWSF